MPTAASEPGQLALQRLSEPVNLLPFSSALREGRPPHIPRKAVVDQCN